MALRAGMVQPGILLKRPNKASLKAVLSMRRLGVVAGGTGGASVGGGGGCEAATGPIGGEEFAGRGVGALVGKIVGS